MRLLVVFPSRLRGGAEEYALSVGRAGKERGWDVHAAFPRTAMTESLVEDFSNAGIPHHPVSFREVAGSRVRMLARHALNLERAIAILRQIRPDVVLANEPWPRALSELVVACGMLGIPTAVVIHMAYGCDRIGRIQLRFRKWAQKRRQRYAAVSEGARAGLARLFEITPAAIARIDLGIRMDRAVMARPQGAIREEVRQELGLEPNARIVLTVGQLSPVKGHDLLVPVISAVARDSPQLSFLWAGDGPAREDLEAIVRRHDVAGRVVFLGNRTDVPRLLRGADLFVLPSRYESFGLAVLEAMAYGLPVVTSDGGSLPELVVHEEHGILFESGNGGDLEAKVRWALRHPEEMRRLAANAQQRAAEYSPERMNHETLEILESLCGGPGGSPVAS